jgi:hypothetical protein
MFRLLSGYPQAIKIRKFTVTISVMGSMLDISTIGVTKYGIKIILSFLRNGSGNLFLNLGGKMGRRL